MAATTVGQGRTYLPSSSPKQLSRLEELLSEPGAVVAVRAGAAAAEVPDELRRVLLDVVASLRRGSAITVAPHALRLTTQQAADLLGISRPTFVKLLEAGEIPYEVPSRHRRVLLADLLVYQERRRQDRRGALDELTAEAQDLGLYDLQPQDYESALDEARRKRA
jgi:excisionase family DNA binding protein